jgi:hypothetical protein
LPPEIEDSADSSECEENEQQNCQQLEDGRF